MKRKIALITGITGQDGSYLAEILLEKEYKVYGLKRRTSSNGLGNIKHLENNENLEIIEGDLTDLPSLISLVKLSRPHELYNLGAQSHVKTSFDQPIFTQETNGLGLVNCLEAVRHSNFHTKIYQAATSEMFGGIPGSAPQNEETPFCPRSPYGAAKLYAFEMGRIYRDSYRMFISNGILFNHESERRGESFVTRKITKAVANIKLGKQKKLFLGNLDAKRDWGHSRDYCRGMHMMLQHHEPDDFVLATGTTHTVREFCDAAFSYVGLDYKDYVEIDPQFYRPCEVNILLGDPSKAKNVLGWKPEISFKQLAEIMVKYDLKLLGG